MKLVLKAMCLATITAITAVTAHAQQGNFDSAGWVPVSQIRTFDNHIGIYFADGQEHQCSGGLKTRFLLNTTEDKMYSLLMASYLAGREVQIRYICNGSGIPEINGVRSR